MAVIHFYKNNSDHNVVKKFLTSVVSVNGTFRDAISVMDPVFTIELSTGDIFGDPVDLTSIMKINYCHIPEFKRYYYIIDIVCIRNGLWQFTCHVDVLKTYEVEISSQNAVIARQEYLYNLYLPDDRLLVTSQRTHTTLDFPNKVEPITDGAPSFVFILAGGKEETS